MKCIKCIVLCWFIVLISGCAYGYDYTDSKEELTVFTGRNFSMYQFSGKAVVNIRYGVKESDYLGVATTDYKTDEDWATSAQSILTGTFEKIGWNNFNLFILMDNQYYVFDIKSYQITDKTDDIVLKQYSGTELETAYPKYRTYDWCEAHDDVA